MFESWTRGIRYSKTALQPQGRVTRSVIVVGAMDLLAACHLSQPASHSAHIYCTVCQCVHRTTLGRTDVENWLFHDDSITKMHANQWKSARTTQDQENIFRLHGTRYSELWRLEYWCPSHQLLVDVMHCLLENQGPTHFRILLGLTSASAALRNPLMSKPIACELGGGKAPRLSEVHCDRDSVCVKTDTRGSRV